VDINDIGELVLAARLADLGTIQPCVIDPRRLRRAPVEAGYVVDVTICSHEFKNFIVK
jgi:hypothetical protein